MTAEEKLKVLMNLGYNIRIECKSIDREYALTYEATASSDAIFTSGHAVGNTLDELLDKLIESIKLFNPGVTLFN